MITLFDGATAPLTDMLWGLLGLIPALWALYRKLTGRPLSLWVPLIGIALGLLVGGTAYWDIHRVRQMLATGVGVHVTRGAITSRWSLTSRDRDWTKKDRLAYKTTISEGFDIGSERFVWTVGGTYSGAAFSNTGTPRIQFDKGVDVEVTWFEDEAENGIRRIIKLAVSKATPPVKGVTSGSFEQFH